MFQEEFNIKKLFNLQLIITIYYYYLSLNNLMLWILIQY